MRRSVILLVLAMAAVLVPPASADHSPVPVAGEPVLRPDSAFEATEWGFKHRDLTFPAENVFGEPWPTIFTMEGYDGASRPAPNAYLRMDDGEYMALRFTFGQGPDGGYAMVQASIRGTECSGGQFNLYDRRHAWDGHHIIEWVADQPWSNGKVGMYGQSYPGQTAYFVASTQPPSLAAVAPSLLHSDIYRDIFMPGGVQNFLFPSVWTYGTGPHRAPTGSLEEGTVPEDEICTQLQASRSSAHEPPQPQDEPAFAALRSTDDDWYAAHAALTYAPAIKIPYYQQTNWQDEQTGPRAVVLYHHINPDPVEICVGPGRRSETIVPKKFVTSSGGHGHGGYASRDRWTFFDIFVRGKCDTTGLMEDQVVNYFESQGDGTHLTKKSGDAWPFADTEWTRLHLREGGALTPEAPTGAEATDTYVSGVPRPGWFYEAPDQGAELRTAGLPDAVTYRTEPLDENTAIAGPILLDLYASMAGVDTDFFVAVSEILPDGRRSYLQRGLLKASHREIDPLRSYYDGDRLVQPYRPHENPQPVTPGEIVPYTIEVFPLGHVFRAGSRIEVRVQTPPMTDGLWGYTPSHAPAAVTIHHDADHPSALQLPVVEPDEPVGDVPAVCPVPDGFPCDGPSPIDVSAVAASQVWP